MPKLKICKYAKDGVTHEATMYVNSSGEFSILPPGTSTKICGNQADNVEHLWQIAVRDFINKNRTDRKVIVVRYDSTLRKGGKRNFFNRDNDFALIFQAAVALEKTVTEGDRATISYEPHPDQEGLHTNQPFPFGMRLSRSDLRQAFATSDWCITEWTQELEDTIVLACEGVKAVVDMLDYVFTVPDNMRLAASATGIMLPLRSLIIPQLPAPK